MGEPTIEVLKRTLRHPDPPQLWYQLQEIVESRTYLQHGIEVREGDVVFDVGANVGVAAAFFALECGAGAVHSFEPVRPIFEQLRQNVSQFPACIPHPYGLSSRSGAGTISYYPHEWALSGQYADPAGESARLRTSLLNLGASGEEADARIEGRFVVESMPCQLRSLSDVLETESIERVDLLKIDVEKAELDVLAGIREADWPAIRQVVAELHLGADFRTRTLNRLEARGFRVTLAEDPAMRGTPVRMMYALRR